MKGFSSWTRLAPYLTSKNCRHHSITAHHTANNGLFHDWQALRLKSGLLSHHPRLLPPCIVFLGDQRGLLFAGKSAASCCKNSKHPRQYLWSADNSLDDFTVRQAKHQKPPAAILSFSFLILKIVLTITASPCGHISL